MFLYKGIVSGFAYLIAWGCLKMTRREELLYEVIMNQKALPSGEFIRSGDSLFAREMHFFNL